MILSGFEMLRVLLLSSLLFLIFLQCNAGDPCPDEAFLSPCTCIQKSTQTEPPMLHQSSIIPMKRRRRNSKDPLITPEFRNISSFYTTVECLGFKSAHELERKVSSALDRKWIDKLVVNDVPPEKGCAFARLPTDWLTNVRTRQLEIKNTQLSGSFISDGDALKDQVESLYWLTVNNCHLSGFLTYDAAGTVQTQGLNELQRLQGIDFSSNHLTAVLASAFKKPPINLTSLILSKNNIEFIETSAFQNIPLLKHIDLSHNLISTIVRSIFTYPPKHLNYIDISWNSLKSLPTDFFTTMPSLKTMKISKNFLYSLPAKPWSDVWKQLLYIDVSEMFGVLLLTSFVLIIFQQCNGIDPCPSTASLSPCTCSQRTTLAQTSRSSELTTALYPLMERDMNDKLMSYDYKNNDSLYTTVECLRVKSVSELEQKVSSALYRKWIDRLVVSNVPPERGHTTVRLPTDWMLNVRIRQFEISNTPLPGSFLPSENPLKDQGESLHWLTVNNCYLYGLLTHDTLGTVQTKELNKLRNLRGLDASSNLLTAVTASAFAWPPPNLTTLVLARNRIQYIETGAFRNIVNLTYIDLAFNELSTITQSIFPYTPRRLMYMNFSWNYLRILPTSFFNNMPALKYVLFSNNFLQSLPANTWSRVWEKLLYIYITGNYIECDCQLMWLLPILNPENSTRPMVENSTRPFVVGECVQPVQEPLHETITHDLLSLTREKVSC